MDASSATSPPWYDSTPNERDLKGNHRKKEESPCETHNVLRWKANTDAIKTNDSHLNRNILPNTQPKWIENVI